MQRFKTAKDHLGALRPDQLASILGATSDVVLFVSDDGVIKDYAISEDALSRELGAGKKWIGKSWSKLLTVESRPKLAILLAEARTEASTPRQINHITASGNDIGIVYTVLRVGPAGTILALGRDLRPVAQLQQRLVAAQAMMDREYEKLRAAQLRYKFLFELTPEPVVMVDSASLDVIDANPSARKSMGGVVKNGLLSAFAKDAAPLMRTLLDQTRVSGRPESAEVKLAGQGGEATVFAAHIREDGDAFYVVRIVPGARTERDVPAEKNAILKFIERGPVGFVMTSDNGSVVYANAAFLEMVNVGSEEAVKGQNVERWIGRPGIDVGILLSSLRQRGAIRLFSTVLKPEFGDEIEVEMSGVSVMNGGGAHYGIMVHSVGQRLKAMTAHQHHRSPDEIKQLIGRVSLKDLVRETTDVIERMGIEAALELTKDNRASAADLLGLSRQSLYIKLRRYGLDNDASDPTG